MNAIVGFALQIENIKAFYMCRKLQRKPGQSGKRLPGPLDT
jgi:hypothetical protein